MGMLPKVTFYRRTLRGEFPIIATLKAGEMVDSGVTIGEYEEFYVSIESDDSNAKLLIETYNDVENKTVRPGKKVLLMDGGNSEDMFVPDRYPFKVITKNVIYEGFYTIRPSKINSESLLYLRTYLEKMLRGLSKDLMRERNGLYQNTTDLSPSVIQVYNHIKDNYQKLRLKFLLESIEKNPLTDITKRYKERVGSRRPDSKSLRWLSQKGLSKNPNPHMPTIVNEKHTKLTPNTIENQWVLYIVRFILSSLRQVDSSYTSHMIKLENKIDSKQKEKQKYEDELSFMNSFGYKKMFELNKGHIERCRRYIEEHFDEVKKVEKAKKEISHMMSCFSSFEMTPWVKEVKQQFPKKKTIRMLKDNRYAALLRFYNDLSKMKQKNASVREKGVPYKRTWKLFEYYTLGLVIDCLKELGYKWEKGWLADHEDPLRHLGTLTGDTILLFKKDNHYIEVAYDTEIEMVNADNSYSRFVDKTSRRPDIRITILNEEKEIYDDHEASLMIDAKCRRHGYLFNKDKNIFTDVMNQLDGYRRLEYFKKESKRSIFPTAEVICLYPKQPGAKPITKRLLGDSGIFIQIEPTDPETNEKPFGYNLLFERVEHFIKNVIREEKVVN
ncbi:MAG: hypothetical protein ACQEWU_07530 [Bacillota bacterium]